MRFTLHLATAATVALPGVALADEFVVESQFVDLHRSLTGANDAIAMERNSRACFEEIDTIVPGEFPPNLDPTMPANELNFAINGLIQGLGDFFSPPSNGASPITYDDYYGIFLETVGRVSDPTQPNGSLFEAQYGIKVVKVCGTCNEYKPPKKDEAARAAYDEYCGKGVYGRDATFSGVALVPVDPSTKEVVEGPLKGLVSSQSIQTDGFQTISVKWPSPSVGGVASMLSDPGFFFSAVPAMMAVSTGKYVGLIVDNMGYGESSDCFKSVFVTKGYQTSVLPLYYATQKMVTDLSDCNTEMVDHVVVNGQSEGGFGALAIAEALDSMGVNILLAQSGTLADVDRSASLSVQGIIDSDLNSRFAYTVAMIGSPYSSSRPDLPNYGIPGQGLLSDGDRAKFVNWANANLEIPDMRLLVTNALGFGDTPLNTGVINPTVIDSVNTTGDMCSDPAGLEDLCAAIDENQLLPSLTSVQYPVEICHSPNDDLIPYNNYAPALESNPLVTQALPRKLCRRH